MSAAKELIERIYRSQQNWVETEDGRHIEWDYELMETVIRAALPEIQQEVMEKFWEWWVKESNWDGYTAHDLKWETDRDGNYIWTDEILGAFAANKKKR